MATRITFDMPFGIKGIDRTLMRISEAAQDMTPAWLAVIARFSKRNARTFREGNGTWPKLSPDYAAWKERHFPGRPILVRTGALLRSLTSEFDVLEVTPTRMAAGSQVEYGRFHQTGGGNLPQRSPLHIPENTRREMVRDVQRHLFASTTAGISGPGATVLE